MATDLGSIIAHLKLDMANFKSGLNTARDEVEQTNKSFRGMESAGKAISSVGKTMTVAGAGIVASLGKVISVAKDWDAVVAQQEFLYKNLDSSVQKFIDTGAKEADALGMTTQQYKNNATGLANSLNLLGMSDEVISKNGESWMSLTADMGAFADVPVDTAIGDLQSALVGNFNALDKYGMTVSVATINSGEYAKALGKTWDKMTQAEKAQAIMNETTRQGKNFTGLAKEEATQFGMTWNQAKQKILEATAALGQKLLPVLAPIVGKIGEVVEKMGKWVDAHPKLVQGIMVAIGIIGLLLITLGPILMIIGGIMTNIMAIRSGIAMFKALNLIPRLGKLFGALLSNPIALVVIAIAALVAAFIWAWNNVDGFKEFWVNLWKTIEKWCSDACATVDATLKSWGDGIVTLFTETLPNGMNAIVTWFSSLPERIYRWLLMTIAKVIIFVTNMGRKADEAARNFVTNIVNGLASLPGKMMTIGGDIVNGIIRGITNGASNLYNSLSNLASNALDSAKERLGINSPSKVFAKVVGRSIPEGIEVGINANAKSLYKTMQGLSDSLTESVDIRGLGDSVKIKTGGININSDTRLLTAISKLESSMASNNIDYDRLIGGFEGAAKRIDSVILMDNDVVGRKTAPIVKKANDNVDKQQQRFRGEVAYV